MSLENYITLCNTYEREKKNFNNASMILVIIFFFKLAISLNGSLS